MARTRLEANPGEVKFGYAQVLVRLVLQNHPVIPVQNTQPLTHAGKDRFELHLFGLKLNVFQGFIYVLFSVGSELGGILILFGIAMAAYRRYAIKPVTVPNTTEDGLVLLLDRVVLDRVDGSKQPHVLAAVRDVTGWKRFSAMIFSSTIFQKI